MITEVMFTKTTEAFLRNGYVKTSGIEIMVAGDQDVMLTPITSKGKPASGYVTIPAGSLAAVAAALQQADALMRGAA